jgi:AAA domain
MSPENVSIFVGQPGSFKSFIAFLMAYCTSTGRDFQNHKCQQGACVIFVGEGDGGIEDRVLALEAQYGFNWSDIPCEVISLSNPSNRCPPYDPDSKTNNKERVEWIKAHVNAVSLKYGIIVNHIIFDTFRTAVNNIDENAAKHVTPAVLHFKTIGVDTGAAVSVFHHTNRELKDYSGSGSFKSDCDNLYFIVRGENMTASLTVDGLRGKQKDFVELEDITFKMVSHVTGEYENGQIVTSLAATISDGASEKTEDVVLTLVKEHYTNDVFDGPLMKSDLLQAFKEREKGTGSDDALNKRFREKHFKPLMKDGLIDYMPSIYVGNAKEDGAVTLPAAQALARAA